MKKNLTLKKKLLKYRKPKITSQKIQIHLFNPGFLGDDGLLAGRCCDARCCPPDSSCSVDFMGYGNCD